MLDILHQKPLLGRQINRAHPLAKGLVGCWVMNEDSGDKIFDLSGNEGDGTLTNMVPSSDWVSGDKGSALDFDGGDDKIIIADKTVYNTLPQRSVLAKVFPRSTGGGGGGRIIEKWNNNSGYLFWGPGGAPDNDLRALIEYDNTDAYSVASTSGIGPTIDTWVHYAMTFDDTGDRYIHIYFQGIELTAFDFHDQAAGTMADDSAVQIYVGNRDGEDRGFDGLFEYLFIYNRVLLPKEIAWSYREPYAMFQQNRVRWFSIPAAGDGVTFALQTQEVLEG